MIGVVIPAHNEANLIGACLRSVHEAASSRRLLGERVLVVVVPDACTDETSRIALASGAQVLPVDARNVGVARGAGSRFCIDQGCRWLAFTDADSVVSADWLADQLALRSEVVCGTVSVRDWGNYGAAMQASYAAAYVDADGHRHVHGANLGVTASAYLRVGGFPPIACSEDVALVAALQAAGVSISWSAKPRVWTSARRDFRAVGGFGDTLLRYEREASARGPAPERASRWQAP